MMPFRTDIGGIAASLPDPLLRVDDAGVVVWRNERFRDLAEGDGRTLLGRPLRELADPTDRAVVDAALGCVDGGASTAATRVRIRMGDGSRTPGVLKFLRTPRHDGREGFVTVLVRVAG